MAKKLAVIFGIIFVIIGLLGFLPGNGIFGHQDAFFLTDGIHDIIHILIGIVLLVASRSQNISTMWLNIFGVFFLLLFLHGLFTPNQLLGFITQNAHDTWLHLALGIILLVAGFIGGKDNIPMMDKTTL
jgi:hypothetical protein